MKRLSLLGLMLLMPLVMFLVGKALVAEETPTPPPATPHLPILAPCLEDPRLAIHDLRIYFGVVADCDALPTELRTAAMESVIESRKHRASILLAAARKDARFRSPCDVGDAHAADALLDHPSFEACVNDVLAYKLERLRLSCEIDIGTYVFLDVVAAHLRDGPGGPWTASREPGDMTSIIDSEAWLCPHAEVLGPPPRPKPSPVTRTGAVWPFHAWDRAEAVTFNHFGQQPHVGLFAYDADGWSEHLVDRKTLTSAQTKHAIDLVKSTDGGVEVSKCPFPRHAVVLYDGDVPVASINVCFECGDILLWPTWPGPAIGTPGWELHYNWQRALHERAFPKWKTFFKDDVGFAVQE